MKKKLNISILLLVCLILVTGCGKKTNQNTGGNNDSGIKVNKNENVIKNQNIDGIEISQVSLVYDNGLSYLGATVTNNTENDYTLNEYQIIIKDADGQIIVTIPGYVGSVIKKGESKNINSVITEDLSKADSIEYKVIR